MWTEEFGKEKPKFISDLSKVSKLRSVNQDIVYYVDGEKNAVMQIKIGFSRY